MAKVKKLCEQCGAVFEVRASLAEQRRFCSIACRAEWQSESRTASNNANWTGSRITKTCQQCGETFTVPENKAAQTFCSRKCALLHEAELGRQTGQVAPGGKITRTCEFCGAPYHVDWYQVQQRFCGRKCVALHKAKLRKS